MNFKRGICMVCIAAVAFSTAACGGGGNSGGKESSSERFDATKLPYYEADIENISYNYTEKQRILPFWQGNVIYNEQLMIVDDGEKTEGHLLYDALRVISVKDATLKTEYKEGADYVVNGDTITIPDGSSIPVFRDEWAKGVNVPERYPLGNAGTGYQMIGNVIYTETSLVWGNYIHVTYAYDPAAADRTAVKSYGDELYGLSQKLANKENIKLTVFGDSISEGCSSSEKWNHEPYCPPYASLLKEGIETLGGVTVDLSNPSVGGKDSVWAAEDEQISLISANVPDVLVLAFGTNDTYVNVEGGIYRKNLKKVISAVKAVNSECQIILVAPFPSNPETKTDAEQEMLVDELKKLAAEDAKSEKWVDVCLVDMYHAVKPMLEKKKYYEIGANNINHPNDFIHRFYAMNVLSAIFDFNK